MEGKKANINWFPGHMAKGYRQIKESLSRVDGVLEIVDARAPISSKSPEFEKLLNHKPRIILLGKADMAPKDEVDGFVEFLAEKYNAKTVAIDLRDRKAFGKLKPVISEQFADRLATNKARGMAGRPLKLMVVGVPNVGKSSFINNAAGGKRAQVQNRPGVTRAQQWIKASSNMELLDTPGVLWPKFETSEMGINLALIGAIKNDVLDVEQLANELINLLRKRGYFGLLVARYGIEDEAQSLPNLEVLELIGRKRGLLAAGNSVALQRVCQLLVDELKNGKLGKVMLDQLER